MLLRGCLFHIFAITSLTYAVRVNMHGSLSLGKEVIDTISHYLRNGYGISARRTIADNDIAQPEDSIPVEVIAVSLCKNLEICINGMEKFVNEYVSALGKAADAVFDGIFSEKGLNQSNKTSIFTRLKGSLHDARKILKAASGKISEDNEAYIWVGVVKRLSSSFQKKSITYIIDGLDADKNVNEIKKKLSQKLVVNIAAAEAKAEKILCTEQHVCLKALECTKSLNTVLKILTNSSDERIKKFMKAFFEALPGTHFYSRLGEATAKEFKDILNDMAFFDNVPTRDILEQFQHTVEIRLNYVDSAVDTIEIEQDVQLVHIILSDMDYIYSKHRGHLSNGFVDYFSDWAKSGGKISSLVKDVVRNIEDQLKDTSDDLVVKLIDEVRVFLELTIDA